MQWTVCIYVFNNIERHICTSKNLAAINQKSGHKFEKEKEMLYEMVLEEKKEREK